MEEKPLRAKAIIEMLGAPKEHIEKTMRDFVENHLKSPESKIEVLEANYEEAEPQGKLFSTFVELHIECKKIDDLVAFCFDAMPSSLEVYQPEELTYGLASINALLNDYAGRIHQTDAEVKRLRTQNNLLNRNSIELLRNFVRYLLRQGHNTLEKISTQIGISEKEMRPFLDRMIEDNQLVLTDGTYSLP